MEKRRYSVLGAVIRKKKGGTMLQMGEKRTVDLDAVRAYMFSVKASNGNKVRVGGYQLKHKPSSYGIALKWLIFIRGMSYSTFAKRYNGTTAQNANHLINRIDKERFFAENVEKMCDVLGVTYEYFTELCEKIEEKMGK